MKKFLAFLTLACALCAHAQPTIQNILPEPWEISQTSAPFRVLVTTTDDTAHVSIQWWDWNHIVYTDSSAMLTRWWMTPVIIPPHTTDTLLKWFVDTLWPSTGYGYNGFLYPGVGPPDTIWASTIGFAYFSTSGTPTSISETGATEQTLFMWNNGALQFHSSVKQAQVYTLQGSLVASTSDREPSTLLLPPGFYVVRCFTRDGTRTRKVFLSGN